MCEYFVVRDFLIKWPKIEVITCVTTKSYVFMDILEETGLSDGTHRIV